MIKLQPNPAMFYRNYLELDLTNVTAILAADSTVTEILLQDDFADYFSWSRKSSPSSTKT